MNHDRRNLIALNVVGGIAVLASYVLWLGNNPESRGALWGGVPEGWQPVYTVSMLTATSGYFAFAQYLFLKADPDSARFGPLSYRALSVLFALILLPSAAWMPLTFAYLDNPSALMWALVRLDLAVVGISSLGLIGALVMASQREPGWSWRLAVLGSLPFFFQTGVLDALVWTWFFPLSH